MFVVNLVAGVDNKMLERIDKESPLCSGRENLMRLRILKNPLRTNFLGGTWALFNPSNTDKVSPGGIGLIDARGRALYIMMIHQ